MFKEHFHQEFKKLIEECQSRMDVKMSEFQEQKEKDLKKKDKEILYYK